MSEIEAMDFQPEKSETTLETTSHGRDLNPPCDWEIPVELESEWLLFKERSSRDPRYKRLSGEKLRGAFWSLRDEE